MLGTCLLGKTVPGSLGDKTQAARRNLRDEPTL